MMKKFLICLLLLQVLTIPATAKELTAPSVDGDAADIMPDVSGNFGQDLWYVVCHAFELAMPNLSQCLSVCIAVIAVSMLLSMLQPLNGDHIKTVTLCGVVCISCILLRSTNTLIMLGADTVEQISGYGRLLLPVLTAALAAQGGTTSSTALYAGTALFDTVLSGLISNILIPMLYIYLALSIVNAAFGDSTIKPMRDMVKSAMTWALKVLLYLFTGYISVTGAVTGTVDQSALKAAKMTISSAVPVIGSIMADASETILVSAGVVKSSVGVYGFLAVVAIVTMPFMKIGLQYGLLKLTATACTLFADKKISALLDDFSGVMGFLLAMTGVTSLLLLISIVCFLKGMS